ncbi:uncharacterized protein LOC124881001 [Girardinichthys multiradiatus]|uniref:uncharacterized protein LOC124881001 n=1 Tax=Girardinichthys multiradiatus TaxID=208333 RepID=UPI001FAE3565|nr:uncharacterized protein LOC124881001 [Girardinichthys multiradiatus]
MHYSFDFAQQMHFPSNPLQPGPMYFLTPRKCGLFGVSCEGLQKQVNFLIDKGMSSGKGSNEVISYMNHFFTHFGVGETDVDLHYDNCTGQNKNNFMLWYGAWRVAHKLHFTLNTHFPIAGHTKFGSDCGFGLIKQAYKRIRVSTLADIAKVVKTALLKVTSTSHSWSDWKMLVNTFDWQAHLSPYFRKLPQIKSYQYFSFHTNRPGVVIARTHSDAEPVSFQRCVTRKFYPLSSVFLPCLHLDWPRTDRLIFIQRLGLSVPMKRRTLHDQHHKHRVAHRGG